MVFIKKKKKKTSEDTLAGMPQDEFQAKGFEIVAWMHDNSKAVLGILGLILAGGVLFSGYLLWSNSANDAASTAFDSATKVAQASQRAAFEKVAKEYSNSSVAYLAEIRAAQLAFDGNDMKGAIKLYQAFLTHENTRGKLRTAGLVGLAFAFDADQNSKQALLTFEQALNEKSGIAEDLLMWQIARLAKLTNETQKAKSNAAMLLERFPNSAYAMQAQMLLSE